MLQDIAPHRFHNEFLLRTAEETDYLLMYRGGRALLRTEGNRLLLPRLSDFPQYRPEDCRSQFRVDEDWFSMLRKDGPEPPKGYAYYSVREYRNFRPMELLLPAGACGSLHRWYTDNRFCGRCGAENTDSATERALICPRCGKVTYPKICPAVIVAVTNGDRLLLTRYRDRPVTSYALIAGFNEIGETIEETVHREVFEETGVRVKKLRFYRSQPWVFTDTLLMGFFCELDGDETITIQEEELSLGEWVPREACPENTAQLSLTGEMIEQFRTGKA